MKIYVINLPQSISRRQPIEANLQQIGLDYEIFPAVDGRNLTVEQQSLVKTEDQVYLSMAGGRQLMVEDKLSLPEIGCALSHLQVYQRILDSGEDYACVLEDDIFLTPKFLEAIEGINQLPKYWEFVNFSSHIGLRNWCFAKKYYFGSSKEQYYQRVGLCNPTLDAIFNRRRFMCMSVTYFIKRSACERLLELGYPVRLPADYLTGLVAYNQLKLFRAFPMQDYYVQLSKAESIISDRPRHHLFRV